MIAADAAAALARALTAALPRAGAAVVVLPIAAASAEELGPEERNRAAAFRVPKRRAEWVGGRIAARRALTAAGLADRGSPTIATGPAGEPVVKASAGTPLPGVSIAHAGGLAAALAFPAGCRMGIDVEPVAATEPGLAALALTPGEVLLLSAATSAGADPTEALLRCWTAKEAAIKVTRTGLGVPLHRVRLTPSGAALDEFSVTLPVAADGPETTCQVRVVVAAGWVGAVAWSDA